ncbi:MIT domain-containing protein 1 [Channa argus]|uniref:MIT domain-containing protein 1 n=1 Tax=Channa argus TaxID=215402 RepID=A0A6G1PXJ7_CHAAH|nr:MIT domain-containing protein 1 [Channa argus]
MTQNHVSGMEASAISLLKRAVELDHSSRFQECLVWYQEGIQLLMDVLKAVTDESKRGHYREKIKGYMDRAEQIKAHVSQMKEDGKYHEQIRILEDAIGYSYESLFKPYISSSLSEVWVEDPYVRHTHQLYNFLRFCEMLLKASCKVKLIHLLTSQDVRYSNKQQCSGRDERESQCSGTGVALFLNNFYFLMCKICFNNYYVIFVGKCLNEQAPPRFKYCIRYVTCNLLECHVGSVQVCETKETSRLL